MIPRSPFIRHTPIGSALAGAALVVGVCMALLSCTVQPPRKQAELAVLIDLSASWHNADAQDRNALLVRTVAEAIARAGASGEFSRLTVRFHAIGEEALYRAPICAASYEPRLLSPRSSNGSEFGDIAGFEQFLRYCTEAILQHRPESSGDAAAAIVTSARSMSRRTGGAGAQPTQYQILVLSDLEPQSETFAVLEAEDLRGVEVDLIYRPLRADGNDVRIVDARIANWTRALSSRGASTIAIPDTGITRESALGLIIADAAPESVAQIAFTDVARCGSGEADLGRLSGVVRSFEQPRAGRIVLYAFAGDSWWVQPFANEPWTEVATSGAWSNVTHLGQQYAALLVRHDYSPPIRTQALPAVGGAVLASATAQCRAA